MIRIAVSGCCGRMGMRIASLVLAEPGMALGAVVEKPGHPRIGSYFNEMVPDAPRIEILPDVWKAMGCVDVLIEFTSPESTVEHVTVAADGGVGCVIGTTGLSSPDADAVRSASKSIPIVMAPNMSVGVNVLLEAAGMVAEKLGPDYNVEIIEAHHKSKKDAPSGTAKKLAEKIAVARKVSLGDVAVYGRSGITGERPAAEIGIHAVRAGDIVGDHTVVFAGPGERLELVHRAHSRDTFAHGALKAARFVHGRKPGLYSMQDVLEGAEDR